ncbi:MAG: hypothetical protein SFW65_07970 [Alphaproteobacteria bacterium]|nr:hypothetical protein [Alphaproteobacteria bacterium]
MNKRPSQTVMESSCIPFNVAWNMFLESPADNPSDFTARFYATQRGVSRALPALQSIEGTIQHATRYASMGYITCGIIKAMQHNSNGTASDLFVATDIGATAVLLMDLNEKVKSFMNNHRPVDSAPLDKKLLAALSDFYTVLLIALNETKPIASRNKDTAKQIDDAIADCLMIADTNELRLHIPRELARRVSGDLLGKQQMGADSEFKLPLEDTPSYQPVPHDHALVPHRPELARTGFYGRPPKAAAKSAAPQGSGAVILQLDDAARERIRRTKLVEAAKRRNPADPGKPPKPDAPPTPV